MQKLSKSERTRKRIEDAAEEEFSEKGLFGARVDEIARKANINKRMLYEYYGCKEELYKVALLNVYRKLEEVEEILFSAETDPMDAIKHVIELHFEYLSNNPSFVRMVMWENLNRAQYLEQTGRIKFRDAFVQAIAKLVGEGKKQGVFSPEVDEVQLPLSLIALSFSYFSNQHTLSYVMGADYRSRETMTQRIEHVTELILRYLQNPKTAGFIMG